MGKDKKHEHDHDTTVADILLTTNPEIFNTPPRPGGFLNISAIPHGPSQLPHSLPHVGIPSGVKCCCPSKKGVSAPKLSSTTVQSNVSRRSVSPSGVSFHVPSREFRLNVTLKEEEKQGDLESDSDEGDVPALHGISPIYKTTQMLSATISCIMMMAAGIANIPDEYFAYTRKFLECQKDEDDNLPYNINGILNHIQYVKMGQPGKRNFCAGSKCSQKQSKTPPPEGAMNAPEVTKENSHRTQSTVSQNKNVYGSPSFSPSTNASVNQSVDSVNKSPKKSKK